MLPEICSATDKIFFVILGHFLPFHPNIDPKIKIWKTCKKKTGDIIFLQMWTINSDHIKYGSWDIRHFRENFLSLWAIFCPLEEKKKKENNSWRYDHFTHVYRQWKSYNVWFLKYGLRRTEFFSFWTIICPFMPPSPHQNFEKMKKKPLKISSLYTSVP